MLSLRCDTIWLFLQGLKVFWSSSAHCFGAPTGLAHDCHTASTLPPTTHKSKCAQMHTVGWKQGKVCFDFYFHT